jgi:CRISPR-associated protein Csh2
MNNGIQIRGNNTNIIENNSEMLFIYDAKMCNPNGDPDDENKPRMDYNRNINLVSDVRLKRYIRDYLMNYKDKIIFVSKIENKTVDATKRLKKLIEENKKEIEVDESLKDLFDKKQSNEKNLSKHLPWLLSKLIDVRFFGATMPLKSEVGKGASITFTGPIQFNWG